MKQTRNMLIGIMAATAWLLAGNVGTLTTFTANTTAKASEVNGNFSAVKTAVDGNAKDIKTNANDIATNAHDITTNTNSINTVKGDYVSSVTAGTGLTGGGYSGDVTLKPADGYVAIHPAAFVARSKSTECVTTHGAAEFRFEQSTKNDCEGLANVFLPDGATITSLKCKITVQNSAPSAVGFSLIRYGYSGGSTTMATTGTTSAGTWQLGDISIDDPVVDNENNYYFLNYNPPDNTDTSQAPENKIHFCRIGYTYN